MFSAWRILPYCLLVLLASCAGGGKPSAISSVISKPALNNGVCEVKGEWAGYLFDIEIKRIDKRFMDVKIDMSRTPWDVGVVSSSLDINGKKLLPSQATAGAVTEHASNNIPAMIGAAGILFDQYRNRKVGNQRRIGTAATTAVAGGLMLRATEQRKQQFESDTALWAGLFATPESTDCHMQLSIRFWSPEAGVVGHRSVDVGKCFCQ